MSMILLSGGLFALFLAVVLFVYNLVPAERPASVSEPVVKADTSQLPLWFKLPYPFAAVLAPIMHKIPWPSYRAKTVVALQRAGMADVYTTDHLLGLKVLSAIVVPLLVSQLFEAFRNPALFVITMFGGFILPDRLVNDLRKKREKAIIRALPGSVDVLSLSVEAGLEFLMAIRRLVERGSPSPLRDELATILNDIRLGQTRSESLKAFAKRVAVPEVSSFVSVLVQADALGASIGPVLAQQAERMRTERFQRAEKEGAKASQKILFPLVLCIFPCVLIVILGPVALNFIYGAR
jgi:tight adherence protein C